jgi:hypothetical protein
MAGWRLSVKVGDLVWHIQDLKDGLRVPGLIMGMQPEGDVVVRFVDRVFDEYHDNDDLTSDTFIYFRERDDETR